MLTFNGMILDTKIEAIVNITSPKNKLELWWFLNMDNFETYVPGKTIVTRCIISVNASNEFTK